MKHLIIILAITILASPCMAWITSNKDYTPIVAYDPNSVIVSPSDPNNVRMTIIIEVPKNQYRAMQYLDLNVIDIFKRSGFKRVWDSLIERAKAKWVKQYTFEQLEAKE